MLRYIAIDTSDWPSKTAIHVLASRKNKVGTTDIEGGYKVLHSTVLETNDWTKVAEIVEKVKDLYNISDKFVFRRNVRENLGTEQYEQLKNNNNLP